MYVWCFCYVEAVVGRRKEMEERRCARKSGRSGGVEEVSALAVTVVSVDRYDPRNTLAIASIFVVLVFLWFK